MENLRIRISSRVAFAMLVALGLFCQPTLQNSELSTRMLQQMFNHAPAGYRWPFWLQIVTFIILMLVIVASIGAIVVFSQSSAGPPRINNQVFFDIGSQMNGMLNNPRMGAPMGGPGQFEMSQMSPRRQMSPQRMMGGY